MNQLKTFLFFNLLLTASNVLADILSDLRGDGFLELGATVSYIQDPDVNDADNKDGWQVDPAISANYRFGSLFAEGMLGALDGINLGVTLWQNEYWSVDALAASYSGRLNLDDSGDSKAEGLTEVERDKAIMDRDTVMMGVGMRTTVYVDDYILQYRLTTDALGGEGVQSSLRIGRGWQLRNWNLHTILGTQYNSAGVNQYLYGIEAAEATTRFNQFEVESSFSYVGEIGLSYPLSQHVVLRSFYRYTTQSSEIQASPLVKRGHESTFNTTVNYVF